jgi:hypothetical protein
MVNTLIGYFSYCLGTMGELFYSLYSVRLLYLTFMSKPSGYRQVICFAYDSGINITFALGCLAIQVFL